MNKIEKECPTTEDDPIEKLDVEGVSENARKVKTVLPSSATSVE